MITVTVGSGITALPTAPTLDDGSVEALQAMESYEIVCTLRNMRAQGYTLTQAESSDFQAAETAFNSLSDYTKGWLSSAVSASISGDTVPAFDKSYIPEIITFIALLATQQWGAIFVLFVKVGLEFLIDSTEKKLDPEAQTGDLAEIFKQVLAYLDENGNIIGSRIDGLSNLKILINTDSEAMDSLWSSESQ